MNGHGTMQLGPSRLLVFLELKAGGIELTLAIAVCQVLEVLVRLRRRK